MVHLCKFLLCLFFVSIINYACTCTSVSILIDSAYHFSGMEAFCGN